MANTKIKDCGVKAPDHFDLDRADRDLFDRGPAVLESKLFNQSVEYALAQNFEIACVQPEVPQAGKQEEPHPFIRENHLGVITVETNHPRLQRDGPVGDGLLPEWIPAPKKDVLIDTLDQSLLVGEITIEQRLRDPKPLGKFTGLPFEPTLGEKRDRLPRNDRLSIRRIEPVPR